MSEQLGIGYERDIEDMEELAPVFLFAMDGDISGGCEAGSGGWKCDVRATEHT